jgi:putative transcriptional regulator
VSELAPGFLVASPTLRDPNFARAVVVMVEHGEDGSLGFVINRPAPVTFKDVAELLQLPSSDDPPSVPVLLGGPVAPQSGWILFDPRQFQRALLKDAVEVGEHLAVSASRRLLEALAAGEGPPRSLLALGYAGWGAGQLDEEFKRGVWIPVDLKDELIFEADAEARWPGALRSAGIDPARLTGGGFSA